LARASRCPRDIARHQFCGLTQRLRDAKDRPYSASSQLHRESRNVKTHASGFHRVRVGHLQVASGERTCGRGGPRRASPPRGGDLCLQGFLGSAPVSFHDPQSLHRAQVDSRRVQGFRFVEPGMAGAGPKGSRGRPIARGFPGFRPKRLQPRPPLLLLRQIEKGESPAPRGKAATQRSRR
jgi:hypothetical protein